MSIELQTITLILNILILVAWLLSKKFDCYNSKYFKFVLGFSTITSLINFVFALLNLNLFEIAPAILVTLIKFNNIFNNILVFITCTYIYAKLTTEERHKFILFPVSSIPLIETIVLLIVTINVNSDSGLFIYDSNLIVSYGFILIYVLLLIVLLFIYRNKANTLLKTTIVFIMLCYVTGIVFEYFINVYGIVQLCSVVAVGGCLLLLENPLNKTNKKYNCFDSKYLNEYLNDYYKNNREGFCAYVSIKSKFLSSPVEEKMSEFKKRLIKELEVVPELTTFLTFEDDLFIVCSNIDLYNDFVLDLNEDVLAIKEKLKIDSSFKTVIVFGKNIQVTSSSENIYRHMHIMASKGLNSYKYHSVLYLNEKFIALQEDEESIKKMIIEALNNDGIEAYYQPIYAPKKAKFTSAEALVRIRDNNGNIVLPKYFIKTAENTGLIIDIGLKMFEKVCQLLKSPKMKDISLNGIDINLSLIECENPNLADNLIKIAKKYQIEPSMINFDITEANLETVYENMSKNIEKLHNFGFKLSLDDFGTKDTKLSYLLNIPISCVKIDRHVIWDYFENHKTKQIVQKLIKICEKLRIEVSATGIEKISQLNEMSNQEVDYIQGYYFFKPMPEEEYMKFLKPNAFQTEEMARKLENIAIVTEK